MTSRPTRRRKSERGRAAHARGHAGEALAALFLRLKGYRILARRFRARGGEIDIVARRGPVLVFVEVKAHMEEQASLAAVHTGTQARILRAAEQFAMAHPRVAGLAWRFDVIAVPRLGWPRHLRAAFRQD